MVSIIAIKHFYSILIISQHTVKQFKVLVCITNNSVKHQLFVHTLLNGQTVRFLTIQFTISHLFAHSWMVKQFYLTHRLDPIRCYHFGSELTWEQWQWSGTQHSSKLQHYWSLAIRMFSVISRTLVGGSLTLLQRSSQGILQPQPTRPQGYLLGESYLSAEIWSNGLWKVY